MILTNNEIYNYAAALNAEFGPECDIRFPVKINFFLQKNIKLLTDLAQDIDNTRLAIAREFGELNADGTAYTIPDEKMDKVAEELNDLFNLAQDINIRTFNINDFNDIELSYKQMNVLMFMIED